MAVPEPPLERQLHGASEQAGGTDRSSPSYPDLARLQAAWNGPDATYLVRGDWIVEAWNPRCQELWGISAQEAIGRRIDDLIDWEALSGPGREIQLIPHDVFEWSERTVDRPKVGSRQGEVIVVDDTIAVERDRDGTITRFVVTSRDVTRPVMLAQEMAPLSALATSSGAVRDRRAIAGQALEILRRSTGADEGVVALVEDSGFELLAEINAEHFGPLLEQIDPRTSPMVAALNAPNRVISGNPETLPFSEATRALAAALHLRWMVVVALRSGGDVRGVLALGWLRSLPEEAPETLVLQAAAHLIAALENARLLEELDARFQSAQEVSARLEALVGLSRLPDANDVETLARSVLEGLVANLAAAAGAVWRLVGDRWVQVAEVGLHRAVVRFHRDASAFELNMWGGTGVAYRPYIRRFASGSATDAANKAAAAAGYTARAAFPVEEDGRIAMVLVLYFSGPRNEPAIDDRTLEAIGRSVSAAFSNQHLRERLVDAVATQHALAEQYSVMFRDSPNALVRMSAERRIVDINEAAVALLGGTAEDWLARSIDDLVVIEPPVRERLVGPGPGERAKYEVVGRRNDGSTFPMKVVVSSLTIDGAQSFLVYVRDLSEERRKQSELVQAQKMDAVGQLVAGVAHELNNPLAAIIGFSQILERDPRLPEEMRRDAELLVQEAARTKRIVGNLLDFARQRPPESHPTRLRPLVDSVLELQAYQFTGEWLKAEVDIPKSIPAVPLDRSQMQQVILNLTQNGIQAIRAKGSPGTLRIVAELVTTPGDPGLVRLSIEDDGPGVPEASRSRLFLPFFTTREPGQGTGLGLSVSFGIVTAHGGRLSYAPRPGGGSIFTVELPLDGIERHETEPAPVEASARETAPIDAAAIERMAMGATHVSRVLVLDDEPAIRAYLDRALRASGFAPTFVATGREALAATDAERFDAMLCDHRMPGMTGTDVYEALATRHPDLAAHFILMSGDALNPRLHDFAKSRGLRVLEKPFDIEMVTTVVHETLGTTG